MERKKKQRLQSQSLLKQTLNQCRSRKTRALHNCKGINSIRSANYPKYMGSQYRSTQIIKQVLRDLQRDLDSHTIIVRDFNTPLSILDRSMRQKINKDIQDLYSALDQADLIDMQNSLPKINRIYILLSTTSHLF